VDNCVNNFVDFLWKTCGKSYPQKNPQDFHKLMWIRNLGEHKEEKGFSTFPQA